MRYLYWFLTLGGLGLGLWLYGSALELPGVQGREADEWYQTILRASLLFAGAAGIIAAIHTIRRVRHGTHRGSLVAEPASKFKSRVVGMAVRWMIGAVIGIAVFVLWRTVDTFQIGWQEALRSLVVAPRMAAVLGAVLCTTGLVFALATWVWRWSGRNAVFPNPIYK